MISFLSIILVPFIVQINSTSILLYHKSNAYVEASAMTLIYGSILCISLLKNLSEIVPDPDLYPQGISYYTKLAIVTETGEPIAVPNFCW